MPQEFLKEKLTHTPITDITGDKRNSFMEL
jgi:hypothetical protein